MISVLKTGATEQSLDSKLSDLKSKIRDRKYLNNAIDRIASVLSSRLVEAHGVTGNSAEFMLQ
jgi:hypothetical protein